MSYKNYGSFNFRLIRPFFINDYEYMTSNGNHGRETEDRKLSQRSVDGFWILLVLGVLFHKTFIFGSSSTVVNLHLYDAILPLIFFIALVLGQITWPERKTVLLFLSPCFLVVLHSVLTAVLVGGTNFGSLFVGTLRQVAFFIDIGMLILLFQKPERLRPSQGVFFTLLFVATAYALMARYLEAYIPGWSTYETIYASIITGLLMLFLFMQRSGEKSEGYLKTIIPIAWVFSVLLLLFSKIFVLVTFFLGVLFFTEKFRESGKQQIKRLFFSAGLFAALVALFIVMLVEMNFGRYFVNFYSTITSEVYQTVEIDLGHYFASFYSAFASVAHQSIEIRFQLWSSAWKFVVETFPWGTGLNQFTGYINETYNSQGLRLVSIHNTPLRLLMELGILGVGIFGAVLAIIVFSLRQLNAYQRAMLCLYILPTILLHDALGLRIFHIVLAFCLAMTVFQTSATLKELRSP